MRVLWTILPIIVISLASVGCDDGDDPQGGEGQACYPNDTCNVGLECVDGICEAIEDDCGNGTCDAGETQTDCPEDCGTPPECGNDEIEGSEVCDGADLGNDTCLTQGFDGGDLACLADCSGFETTGCIECGNNEIEGSEVCDGTDFGGETCISQDFDQGELACLSDCSGLDTSGCSDIVCTDLPDEECGECFCTENQAGCDYYFIQLNTLCACGSGAPCASQCASDCPLTLNSPLSSPCEQCLDDLAINSHQCLTDYRTNCTNDSSCAQYVNDSQTCY